MSKPNTLSEIQAAIAARVSDFPPEQQTKIMEVAEYSYLAGFKACQDEYRVASNALGRACDLIH